MAADRDDNDQRSRRVAGTVATGRRPAKIDRRSDRDRRTVTRSGRRTTDPKPEPRTPSTPKSERPRREAGSYHMKPYVMVVDDSGDGREMLAEYLAFRGLSVIKARDGESVL